MPIRFALFSMGSLFRDLARFAKRANPPVGANDKSRPVGRLLLFQQYAWLQKQPHLPLDAAVRKGGSVPSGRCPIFRNM